VEQWETNRAKSIIMIYDFRRILLLVLSKYVEKCVLNHILADEERSLSMLDNVVTGI
jgi:hypothetical protein